VSCTDIRLQIDRQPRVSDSSSDQELEQIRAHTRSCVNCAEYLDRAEQVEQMLLNLPEIEPCSDLSVQVMARLNKQVSQQAPEPRPSPGLVSPLVQQLLKNLSVLLACAGLLASVRAGLSAHPFIEFVAGPHIIFGPSALVQSGQTAVFFVTACLLLLLSLKVGPRPDQIRNRVGDSRCT
jgi:hypothetical protein